MKISVVVPVYNEEGYIKNLLESLMVQTVKPDEIIIIDNNCYDNTVKICQEYPVRIVKEKKQGMIFARNRGFDEARYEIIARCDADIICPPNWIETIKENFATGDIDALNFPLVFYDLPFPSPLYVNVYLNLMKLIQKGKETLQGPNMVLTKNIWQKVKNDVCLDDTKVHEDIDLAIHINEAGGKIKRINSLVIKASGRRIKNHPFSFFYEYPKRLINTLRTH